MKDQPLDEWERVSTDVVFELWQGLNRIRKFGLFISLAVSQGLC